MRPACWNSICRRLWMRGRGRSRSRPPSPSAGSRRAVRPRRPHPWPGRGPRMSQTARPPWSDPVRRAHPALRPRPPWVVCPAPVGPGARTATRDSLSRAVGQERDVHGAPRTTGGPRRPDRQGHADRTFCGIVRFACTVAERRTTQRTAAGTGPRRSRCVAPAGTLRTRPAGTGPAGTGDRSREHFATIRALAALRRASSSPGSGGGRRRGGGAPHPVLGRAPAAISTPPRQTGATMGPPSPGVLAPGARPDGVPAAEGPLPRTPHGLRVRLRGSRRAACGPRWSEGCGRGRCPLWAGEQGGACA